MHSTINTGALIKQHGCLGHNAVNSLASVLTHLAYKHRLYTCSFSFGSCDVSAHLISTPCTLLEQAA